MFHLGKGGIKVSRAWDSKSMPEAVAVLFLVTVLGPSIKLQQTGDNYASLANEVQKKN